MSVYLDEQIKTTKDLIDSEPTVISIVRKPAKVRTASGGVKAPTGEPSELDPQTFFFSQVSPDAFRQVQWQGEMVVVRWVIVGMPDADLLEGDQFTIMSKDFTVIDVHPDRRWETRGWIIDKS